MEKIIVTGGAGFVGSNISNALAWEGFEVHVLDNLSAGKKENLSNKVFFHHADITKFEEIAPLFKGVSYVFHQAALPRVQYSIEHPIETNNANVSGTVNVLEAARASGTVKRVVYAASSSAYGDQDVMPLKENMVPNPKSPYGLQKYIGELYMKMWYEIYGLSTVSLRYFNVYGAGQSDEGAYALVIAKFLKQKREGLPMTITGDGEQTRDFTNIKDVVLANILAMKSGKVGAGEVINIGAGNSVSVNRIAELIGGPTEYTNPRLEPKDTLADNSLAKDLLGWQPSVSIEEGIGELKKLLL